MRKSVILWFIAIGISVASVVAWLALRRSPASMEPLLSVEANYRSGDLVFRQGAGLMSKAILRLQGQGLYTHVGLLVHTHDKWLVVHAVPDEHDDANDSDRVKVEPLQQFLAPTRCVRAAVMRVDCSEAQAQQAAQVVSEKAAARVPFDHRYSDADTTAFYCTELVCHAYRRVGIDLAEGHSLKINYPTLQAEVVLPQHLIDGGHLHALAAE